MRILGIDQGTSGTKAVVVDESGAVCGLAERAVHPRSPSPGAVEQDPLELLDSVLDAGRAALAEAGGAIDAVALANQGETVLAWDRTTGRPLTDAMVWQDSRAQEVCDGLVDRRDLVAARTGLVLDPYFSAPKMAWLRRHWSRDGVVTTSDAWLVHQLTGAFVTDATTASRSLLLDLDSVSWDGELLSLFGLDGEALPHIARNDEVVGSTSAFGADLPVAGLVVDQQAALFAEQCLAPGDVKCTYGTGAFLLAATGARAARSTQGLTTSVAHSTAAGTQYCMDGQVFTVASALRWLGDLGILTNPRDLDAAAADSSDGVRFVPALAGLGAPWWAADARASLTGLSLASSAGHVVRAVVEGIAATVAALLEAVSFDSGAPMTRLRVDGGLTRSAALMQAQADLAQVPVEVYPSAHATALGTAAFARLAAAPEMSPAAAVWPWKPERVFEPQWSADRAAAFRAGWDAAAARVAEEADGDS